MPGVRVTPQKLRAKRVLIRRHPELEVYIRSSNRWNKVVTYDRQEMRSENQTSTNRWLVKVLRSMLRPLVRMARAESRSNGVDVLDTRIFRCAKYVLLSAMLAVTWCAISFPVYAVFGGLGKRRPVASILLSGLLFGLGMTALKGKTEEFELRIREWSRAKRDAKAKRFVK